MFAGDSGSFAIKIKKNGAPFNFIDNEDKLRWGVSRSLCNGGLAFLKEVETFTDGAAIFRIDPEDTKDLIGRFVYDIEWTDKDGNVNTLMPDFKLGKFIVVGGVTE